MDTNLYLLGLTFLVSVFHVSCGPADTHSLYTTLSCQGLSWQSM